MRKCVRCGHVIRNGGHVIRNARAYDSDICWKCNKDWQNYMIAHPLKDSESDERWDERWDKFLHGDLNVMF